MADDTRARILDLAVEAIDRGGEAAIRVKHIVAEVGVTPPVLYYHFGSRDGLVVAAQAERYTRRHKAEITAMRPLVEGCTSREELKEFLLTLWSGIFAENSETRWRRINVLGSAYARPELTAEVARAQDEVIDGLFEILEPCLDRGWLRNGIDLKSALTWQYSILSARAFIEHGAEHVDPAEWDRLTLEAFQQVFFGD